MSEDEQAHPRKVPSLFDPVGGCHYSGASEILSQISLLSLLQGGHSFEATVLSLVSHPLWSGCGSGRGKNHLAQGGSVAQGPMGSGGAIPDPCDHSPEKVALVHISTLGFVPGRHRLQF